jgi:hypothetical protein
MRSMGLAPEVDVSTITDDIATIQDFASSTTLGILVDVLTIAGMLGLILAQLGLRADRRRRGALPPPLRAPVQEGGEDGDARGPAP